MIKDYLPSKWSMTCKNETLRAILRSVGIGVAAFGLLVVTMISMRSEEVTGLWGVWYGKTIGAEVYLCIQADPAIAPTDEFAAIYTTADFQIELLDHDKKVRTKWYSRADKNVTVTLSALKEGSIKLYRNVTNDWSGIELTPIPFTKEDQVSRPCESTEFNQSRAILPPMKIASKTLDGASYDALTLVDPAGHGEVSTFQLASGSFGHEAINNWLRAVLPKTAQAAPYYTCTVEALGSGRDSLWEQRLFPEMISDRFIVVGNMKDVYCGGPYPDSFTEWTVFNSRTGKEVDTLNWIHPDAFNLLGPNPRTGPEIGDPEIETEFRDLINQAFAATNPDASCNDFIEYVKAWNVRPSTTGFILSPTVTHAEQGCAVDLKIDYRDMEFFIADVFLDP